MLNNLPLQQRLEDINEQNLFLRKVLQHVETEDFACIPILTKIIFQQTQTISPVISGILQELIRNYNEEIWNYIPDLLLLLQHKDINIRRKIIKLLRQLALGAKLVRKQSRLRKEIQRILPKLWDYVGENLDHINDQQIENWLQQQILVPCVVDEENLRDIEEIANLESDGTHNQNIHQPNPSTLTPQQPKQISDKEILESKIYLAKQSAHQAMDEPSIEFPNLLDVPPTTAWKNADGDVEQKKTEPDTEEKEGSLLDSSAEIIITPEILETQVSLESVTTHEQKSSPSPSAPITSPEQQSPEQQPLIEQTSDFEPAPVTDVSPSAPSTSPEQQSSKQQSPEQQPLIEQTSDFEPAPLADVSPPAPITSPEPFVQDNKQHSNLPLIISEQPTTMPIVIEILSHHRTLNAYETIPGPLCNVNKALEILNIKQEQLIELITNESIHAIYQDKQTRFSIPELTNFWELQGEQHLLGEILCLLGIISQEHVQQALHYQQANPNRRIGWIFLNILQCCSDENLARALAIQNRLPYLDVGNCEIEEDVIRQCPFQVVANHSVFPVCATEYAILLAVTWRQNLEILDDLQMIFGCRIDLALTSTTSLEQAIHKYYSAEREASPIYRELPGIVTEKPPVSTTTPPLKEQDEKSSQELAELIESETTVEQIEAEPDLQPKPISQKIESTEGQIISETQKQISLETNETEQNKELIAKITKLFPPPQPLTTPPQPPHSEQIPAEPEIILLPMPEEEEQTGQPDIMPLLPLPSPIEELEPEPEVAQLAPPTPISPLGIEVVEIEPGEVPILPLLDHEPQDEAKILPQTLPLFEEKSGPTPKQITTADGSVGLPRKSGQLDTDLVSQDRQPTDLSPQVERLDTKIGTPPVLPPLDLESREETKIFPPTLPLFDQKSVILDKSAVFPPTLPLFDQKSEIIDKSAVFPTGGKRLDTQIGIPPVLPPLDLESREETKIFPSPLPSFDQKSEITDKSVIFPPLLPLFDQKSEITDKSVIFPTDGNRLDTKIGTPPVLPPLDLEPREETKIFPPPLPLFDRKSATEIHPATQIPDLPQLPETKATAKQKEPDRIDTTIQKLSLIISPTSGKDISDTAESPIRPIPSKDTDNVILAPLTEDENIHPIIKKFAVSNADIDLTDEDLADLDEIERLEGGKPKIVEPVSNLRKPSSRVADIPTTIPPQQKPSVATKPPTKAAEKPTSPTSAMIKRDDIAYSRLEEETQCIPPPPPPPPPPPAPPPSVVLPPEPEQPPLPKLKLVFPKLTVSNKKSQTRFAESEDKLQSYESAITPEEIGESGALPTPEPEVISAPLEFEEIPTPEPETLSAPLEPETLSAPFETLAAPEPEEIPKSKEQLQVFFDNEEKPKEQNEIATESVDLAGEIHPDMPKLEEEEFEEFKKMSKELAVNYAIGGSESSIQKTPEPEKSEESQPPKPSESEEPQPPPKLDESEKQSLGASFHPASLQPLEADESEKQSLGASLRPASLQPLEADKSRKQSLESKLGKGTTKKSGDKEFRLRRSRTSSAEDEDRRVSGIVSPPKTAPSTFGGRATFPQTPSAMPSNAIPTISDSDDFGEEKQKRRGKKEQKDSKPKPTKTASILPKPTEPMKVAPMKVAPMRPDDRDDRYVLTDGLESTELPISQPPAPQPKQAMPHSHAKKRKVVLPAPKLAKKEMQPAKIQPPESQPSELSAQPPASQTVSTSSQAVSSSTPFLQEESARRISLEQKETKATSSLARMPAQMPAPAGPAASALMMPPAPAPMMPPAPAPMPMMPAAPAPMPMMPAAPMPMMPPAPAPMSAPPDEFLRSAPPPPPLSAPPERPLRSAPPHGLSMSPAPGPLFTPPPPLSAPLDEDSIPIIEKKRAKFNLEQEREQLFESEKEAFIESEDEDFDQEDQPVQATREIIADISKSDVGIIQGIGQDRQSVADRQKSALISLPIGSPIEQTRQDRTLPIFQSPLGIVADITPKVTKIPKPLNRPHENAHFEKALGDEAGRPGAVERLIAQSVLFMKGMQITVGLKFVLIAQAVDIFINMFTTYINNIFQTWKMTKTIKRALERRKSGRERESVLDDLAKARFRLSRFLHLPGFYLEDQADLLPTDKDWQKLSDTNFPLQLALEMRGHLDEMKRDLSLLTARQTAQFLQKSFMDFALSFIPNPADLVMPWKDFFVMLFWMKYSRTQIRRMYADMIASYSSINEALWQQKNQNLSAIQQNNKQQATEKTENNIEQPNPNSSANSNSNGTSDMPIVNLDNVVFNTGDPAYQVLADYEKQLLIIFGHKHQPLPLEMGINQARESLQRIIQMSCKLDICLQPQRWARWELVWETKQMHDMQTPQPLLFLELERWLTQTIAKILAQKGIQADPDELEYRYQEAKDFYQRWKLLKQLQKYFV